MKCNVLFVFFLQILPVKATDDASVGAVIGSIAAILCVIVIFALGYYCYRKNKQHRDNYIRSSPIHGNNSHSIRTQEPFNNSTRPPPPSYFKNECQPPSNKSGYTPYDLPPSYSTHMKLYHTHTSGQPLVSGSVRYGVDNHAFLNRSISSLSELPSMADVLLTSSRMSIPAALKSEEHAKINKLSNSACDDSIESKVTSNGSKLAFDNPRFSMSLENEDHQKPENVLNKRFETYTDSESELSISEMGGRWLESIKNKSQSSELKSQISQEIQEQNSKYKNSYPTDPKTKLKSAKSHEEITVAMKHKKKATTKIKTKAESSDSGAEVSSNPQGGKDRGSHNETRLSKISSDSGLGDVTTAKQSKPSAKLQWNAVEKPDLKANRSLTTEV